MHVEWAAIGIFAAVIAGVVIGYVAGPIDVRRREPTPQGPLLARREWTEDCRVFQHRDCQHIGSARTFGLLGHREFVTVCGCPCHWGCPSEEVSLPGMTRECICAGNGEVRQENFKRFAKLSPLDRILSRLR